MRLKEIMLRLRRSLVGWLVAPGVEARMRRNFARLAWFYQRLPLGGRLWGRWVVATTLAASASMGLGGVVLLRAGNFLFCGLVVGLAVGLAQWWVLRDRDPRSGHWLFMTAIATTVWITLAPLLTSASLMIFMDLLWPPAPADPRWAMSVMGLFGSLSGLLTGVGQWLVVLRPRPGARWWLVLSPLGCGLGLAVGNRLAAFPLGASFEAGANPSAYLGPGLLFGGIAGLVQSGLTGWAIARLFSRPYSP